MTSASCNGVCHQYALKRVAPDEQYVNGRKRCMTCLVWYDYPGNRCLCCNTALRTKRRDKTGRRRGRQAKPAIFGAGAPATAG